MKAPYFIIFISIIGTSCGGSDYPDINNTDPNEETESEEITQEPLESEVISFGFDSIITLFPLLTDSVVLIDVIDYDNPSLTKIDCDAFNEIYKESCEQPISFYAMYSVEITTEFKAYLVGTESSEGLYTNLLIYKTGSHDFADDYMFVAASAGDAGEHMREKSWIVDLNNDGISELLKRSGSTYLNPAAEEDERETTIGDVEVWEFDNQNGRFIRNEKIENQDELNSQFKIRLDEL